ncbi:MarR family transcriptional regulator [soil metagenome]
MPSATPLPSDPIAEAKRQWLQHGWDDAANGMAMVASIMRAQQLMLARVEAALKPFGLSFARFEMLALLSFTREGSMPMASATARLQVHPTSVTSIVDRLEQAGLVERTAHPTDGRATLLTLTAEGHAVATEASTVVNETVFADPGLDDQDIADLISILARLRRNAGDFADPVTPPDPL